MKRLLGLAILALLPLTAGAQRWNAPAARAATVRPMIAPRAPMARPTMVRPSPMPAMRGTPWRPLAPGGVASVSPQWRRHRFHSGHFGFGNFPFGVPPQNRCFSDAFFDPFFCTRTPTRFSSIPFASFVPFASFPIYSTPYLDNDSSYDYSNEAAEQVERANVQASDLAAQVQQLRNELQRLQEQQSSAPAAAAPPPPSDTKDESAVPTTLVFRDGHHSEVENYAIVGNTVWVFTDQRRKKIPLAELDLTATQQVNEGRGVDFPVPPSTK